MGQQIEQLAAFVASARWDDVPDAVRRHTKLVLLDTLGVILAGSATEEDDPSINAMVMPHFKAEAKRLLIEKGHLSASPGPTK